MEKPMLAPIAGSRPPRLPSPGGPPPPPRPSLPRPCHTYGENQKALPYFLKSERVPSDGPPPIQDQASSEQRAHVPRGRRAGCPTQHSDPASQQQLPNLPLNNKQGPRASQPPPATPPVEEPRHLYLITHSWASSVTHGGDSKLFKITLWVFSTKGLSARLLAPAAPAQHRRGPPAQKRIFAQQCNAEMLCSLGEKSTWEISGPIALHRLSEGS